MVPLFALRGVALRHRLRQPHLKLVVPQQHLLAVSDEVAEAVKHRDVGQEERGAASVLPPVDVAVLRLLVTPGGHSVVPNECLALPDKAGAIRAPSQCSTPSAAAQPCAAPCTLLPACTEPFLHGMQLGAVAHLLLHCMLLLFLAGTT